ncbi:MAG: PEGA domain-containing protein, partial [Deltaproteobacteria bacterium]
MKGIFYGLLCSLLAVGLLLPQVILAGSILQISSEPGVSIWLNNEYVGKTTKEENGLIIKGIAPGEYSLRAARQGYNPTETQLVVENDQTIEWRLSFAEPVMNIEDAVKRIDSAMVGNKPVGTIMLKSIPLNAEIFFNEKFIGRADKKINYAPAV